MFFDDPPGAGLEGEEHKTRDRRMPSHGSSLLQGLLEITGNPRLQSGGGASTGTGFCCQSSHETTIRQFAGSCNLKLFDVPGHGLKPHRSRVMWHLNLVTRLPATRLCRFAVRCPRRRNHSAWKSNATAWGQSSLESHPRHRGQAASAWPESFIDPRLVASGHRGIACCRRPASSFATSETSRLASLLPAQEIPDCLRSHRREKGAGNNQEQRQPSAHLQALRQETSIDPDHRKAPQSAGEHLPRRSTPE